MPRAKPLRTTTPAPPSTSPSAPATSSPDADGRRVPTIATAGPGAPHAPRRYRTGGASSRSRSRAGQSASSQVSTRAPAQDARRSSSSTSIAPRHRTINAARRGPIPGTAASFFSRASHAPRAEPNACMRRAMRIGPSAGTRWSAIRHRRSSGSSLRLYPYPGDFIPGLRALSNDGPNMSGAIGPRDSERVHAARPRSREQDVPRLAREHDGIDDGRSPLLAQHARALAQRRAGRHHVIDHRHPRAAEHPGREPQVEGPPHGAPAVPFRLPPQGRNGADPHEKRGREIVQRIPRPRRDRRR